MHKEVEIHYSRRLAEINHKNQQVEDKVEKKTEQVLDIEKSGD